MKTLLTFFVLLFSSSVVAENISDFAIEGIGVGDSLLNYKSENEITNNIQDVFNYIEDDQFIQTGFFTSDSSEYDFIQINIKKNDLNYIVYGISGVINPINIDECLPKLEQVSNELSLLLKNFDKSSLNQIKHPVDSSGNSLVYQISFNLNDNVILVECYDFAESIEYPDSFAVMVFKDELNRWLQLYQ